MRARLLAAVPSSLRRLNERSVLHSLRRLGEASRADLAKAARISQPTAGKIIEELLQIGFLQELDGEAGSREGSAGDSARIGRPGRLLRLDNTTARFIAVELGVGQTRIAAMPLDANDESLWATSFDTGRTPDEWVRNLRRHAPAVAGESLLGVIVSVPGVVDEAAGRVLFSPNLHWTERAHLPELLRAVWPLPVLLVQEIRALALGHLVANPSVENFLFVDFGDGVGGAVIEGGQLFSHPLPLSGELGHTPVAGNSRPCGCGATGCIETLLSRAGLLESFAAENMGRAEWAGLQAVVAGGALPDFLSEALDRMGAILAGALNVLGLRRVVVTGSLTELSPLVIQRLESCVTRGAMWARFGEVICEAAPRRRLAGLVAAGIDRLLFPANPGDTAHRSPLRAAALRNRHAVARGQTQSSAHPHR